MSVPPSDASAPAPVPQFSDDERERYRQQMLLPGWGEYGQARVRAATVFVVGAGALGTAAATYLAGAGVGRLAIVDGSEVTKGDLHRQGLHFPPDVGSGKADSAAAKLGVLNPNVHSDPFPADIDEHNADLILEGADIVLSCVDNATARLLLNDAAVRAGVPLVCGVATAWSGHLLTVCSGASSCLRCAALNGIELVESDDRDTAGIAGPVAGAIGALQALEALKLIVGAGAAAAGRVLTLDGATLTWSDTPSARRPDCTCSQQPGADTL